MRNFAIEKSHVKLVMLLDAVIGLLDADGNPKGLGEGLNGIYKRTWQAIIRKPYRILCNGVQRKGAKLCPDMTSELFCYVPLHKIRHGFNYTTIIQ